MLPIVDALLRREQNQNLIIRRRELRDGNNPFELPEERFIELYRLNKNAVQYVLGKIDNHMDSCVYITSISNVTKLFAALRFYATGSYQRDLGMGYNLSQTSIHRYV